MTAIKKLPPVWLLVLCCAIGPVAMTITQPATTRFMQEFSAEYGVVQLVIGLYLIATAVASIFLGPLSDRFGRRPVMLGGLSVFLIGCLMCAFASSLEWLLVGRLVQGAGGAVGTTLSRAIVRDVHDMDKSASVIGYINVAMVVAPMVGPALGGLLTENISWRLIFMVMAAYSFLLVIAVWKKQNETIEPGSASQPAMLTALPLLKDRRFIGHIINLTATAATFFSFLAGAPHVVNRLLGASPSEYGLYFALSAFGYMLGNLITGRYSQRIGPNRMLLYGLVPSLSGILAFWLLYGWGHPLALFAPMFLITFSHGFIVPNATAAALSVNPAWAGAASGIMGFTQIGGGALMSMLTGFVQNDTRAPLLIVITVCVAMSVLGLRMSRPKT